MNEAEGKRIADLFDELEGNEPEKSTEYLFQMTVNSAAHRFGMEIDSSDVADALMIYSDELFNMEEPDTR